MRAAIVHDWLTGMRGGERCLLSLCRVLPPEVPIFTLFHVPGWAEADIGRREVRSSWLGRYLPRRLLASRRLRPLLLPLFPGAAARLDLGGFDRILSVSHCAAKAIVPPPGARHICYCLTPMRYAWDQLESYAPGPLARILAAPVVRRLRAADVASSKRVDRFVAISRFVASRIRRFYGRDSEILYPPVDLDRFAIDARGPDDSPPRAPTRAAAGFAGCGPPDGGPGGYYLMVAAPAAYKRLDLAVAAFASLGRKLKVVGTSEREARALGVVVPHAPVPEREGGGGAIELLGRVSDEALPELYRRARALVMPGVEDFGIAPLEAMASGRPVVALARGGALETVAHGKTGILYGEPSAEGLAAAVRELERRLPAFDAVAIRASVERFSRDQFEAKLRALLKREGFPLAEATPGQTSTPAAPAPAGALAPC